MGNFFALCRREKCTKAEQEALAWHLAQKRMRQIYEALRPMRYGYPIDIGGRPDLLQPEDVLRRAPSGDREGR